MIHELGMKAKPSGPLDDVCSRRAAEWAAPAGIRDHLLRDPLSEIGEHDFQGGGTAHGAPLFEAGGLEPYAPVARRHGGNALLAPDGLAQWLSAAVATVSPRRIRGSTASS